MLPETLQVRSELKLPWRLIPTPPNCWGAPPGGTGAVSAIGSVSVVFDILKVRFVVRRRLQPLRQRIRPLECYLSD